MKASTTPRWRTGPDRYVLGAATERECALIAEVAALDFEVGQLTAALNDNELAARMAAAAFLGLHIVGGQLVAALEAVIAGRHGWVRQAEAALSAAKDAGIKVAP